MAKSIVKKTKKMTFVLSHKEVDYLSALLQNYQGGFMDQEPEADGKIRVDLHKCFLKALNE